MAEHQERVGRFIGSPVPLYGLDGSWTGTRRLGGFETRESVGPDADVVLATDVEAGLDHGEHDRRDTPFVRVISTTDRNHRTLPWRLVCHVEDTRLAARIIAEAAPHQVPPGARRYVAALPVDGRAEVFDVLERNGHFVALTDRGGHRLLVEGRGVDPAALRLVTVTDLSEYAAGSAVGLPGTGDLPVRAPAGWRRARRTRTRSRHARPGLLARCCRMLAPARPDLDGVAIGVERAGAEPHQPGERSSAVLWLATACTLSLGIATAQNLGDGVPHDLGAPAPPVSAAPLSGPQPAILPAPAVPGGSPVVQYGAAAPVLTPQPGTAGGAGGRDVTSADPTGTGEAPAAAQPVQQDPVSGPGRSGTKGNGKAGNGRGKGKS